MGLLSIAAQNASLDADYGAAKAAGAPASFELALFSGDPANTETPGVEMDSAGGYAAVTVTNDGTNFPAASSGQKIAAVQTFPVSTGEWTAAGVPDTATHWLLRNAATGDWWDSGELADEISVEGAGTTVTVQPVIFYGDEVDSQ